MQIYAAIHCPWCGGNMYESGHPADAGVLHCLLCARPLYARKWRMIQRLPSESFSASGATAQRRALAANNYNMPRVAAVAG